MNTFPVCRNVDMKKRFHFQGNPEQKHNSKVLCHDED